MRGTQIPEQFQRCSVALLRHDAVRRKLVFVESASEVAAELIGRELDETEGVTGLAFLLQQPMRVSDLQRSPNYSPRIDRSTQRSCTSLIAVPLSSPALGEWGMLTIATLAGSDVSLDNDSLAVATAWANALVSELERHV